MYKLIAVIGGNQADDELYSDAVKLGEMLCRFNTPVVSGGGSGVMEAVFKGVKSGGGTTVGILPYNKSQANDFVDIPISTGIGFARNAIIVSSADVVIAVGGGYGTLSELGFALQLDKPVISYKCAHAKHLKIKEADNLNDVVDFVKELL